MQQRLQEDSANLELESLRGTCWSSRTCAESDSMHAQYSSNKSQECINYLLNGPYSSLSHTSHKAKIVFFLRESEKKKKHDFEFISLIKKRKSILYFSKMPKSLVIFAI